MLCLGRIADRQGNSHLASRCFDELEARFRNLLRAPDHYHVGGSVESAVSSVLCTAAYAEDVDSASIAQWALKNRDSGHCREMISAYSSALRKSGQIGKLKELLAFSELSPSELEAVVENTALLALEQQLKVDQLSAFPSDPYATLYAVISGKVLDLAGPDFPP